MKEILIGSQIWSAQNLHTEQYNNGEPIFLAEDFEDWESLGEQGVGAYCYYRNQLFNKDVFGLLYNWHAIMDPRGIVPEGWRIPSIGDWEELVNFFGEDYAGNCLRNGTSEWWINDKVTQTIAQPENDYYSDYLITPTNNLTDMQFNALPGGARGRFGGKSCQGFFASGDSSYFWSSSEDEDEQSSSFFFLINNSIVQTFASNSKSLGMSVRLLKI